MSVRLGIQRLVTIVQVLSNREYGLGTVISRYNGTTIKTGSRNDVYLREYAGDAIELCSVWV